MSRASQRGGTAGGRREDPCRGCRECGLRCTAGIQMTEKEFEGILECLRGQDPWQVRRVLEQEKRVVWFEDIETEQCLFYDVPRQQCIVHQARPLVCRLFGRVEWLPCPVGRPLERLHDGLGVMRSYAQERRATFQQWCAEAGLFDLTGLLRAG